MKAFAKQILKPGPNRLARFARNMLIGLLVIIPVVWMQQFDLLSSTEDVAFDATLAFQLQTDVVEGKDGILWVDIDSETHTAWKEPMHTPRDQVTRMLQKAEALNPQAVLLDIVLEQRGVDQKADAELVKHIAKYGGDCEEKCAPLFIAKRVRHHLGKEVPPIRQSLVNSLDQAVRANPWVHYTSPYQELSDDKVVRRWRLWQCAEQESEVVALLSFQLSSCLARRHEGGDFISAYSAAQERAGALCSKQASDAPDMIAPLCVGEAGPILGSNTIVGRRIVYTMGEQQTSGNTKWISPVMAGRDGRFSPAILRMSALGFVSDKQSLALEDAKDRVVLIGESHHDSADVHDTPIGELPGALIVANTIHSMWFVGEAMPTPIFWRIAILLSVIALMSFVLLWVSSFTGVIAVSILVVIAMVPVSLYLFGMGIWLDFAIPLLVIQAYEIAERVLGAPDHVEDES